MNLYKIYYGFNNYMSVQRVFSIDMSSAVRNIIINYGFY
jgi:hypothetical protein